MDSKTIFDLPTDVSQLPGISDPMSRMEYIQIPPTREVAGTTFPGGQIHHRFQVSGTKRWVPAKSYIRMRCTLTKPNGTTLTTDDGIAPNMGLCSNLFQSAEFRISDKVVSRVGEYLPQVDAIDSRLEKSKAWMDSVGASTNFWQPSLQERIKSVSSDGKEQKVEYDVTGRLDMGYVGATTVEIAADTGILEFKVGTLPITTTNFVAGDEIEVDFATGTARFTIYAVPAGGSTLRISEAKTVAVGAEAVEFRRYRKKNSRQVNAFELVWQPPLSIFKCEDALPAGSYQLTLNPQTVSTYKKAAIESLGLAKEAGATAAEQFNFSVVDMYLYIATVESTRVDDLNYYISLNETRCQVETGLNAGLSTKSFDVSPSTYALTTAFQDILAGTDTKYSASKFKTRSDGEQLLTRLFVSYAGQNKPQPDADPSFVAGSDLTTQRYADSLLQSNSYFREGGAESLQDWQNRGSYYHFAFPRDGRDRSTRVSVHAAIGAQAASTRVLLFDHYKTVLNVTVKDGRVANVNLIEA